MRFSANLSMLFGEYPFSQRFAEAARCGFSFVEFWFPFEQGGKALITPIQDAGVQTILFNLDPGDASQDEWGMLGVPGRESQFKQSLDQAVELAQSLGCNKLNALAGVRPNGAKEEACFDTLRQNIEWASGQLPGGFTLLIEALNAVDKPGYLLPSPERALAIVKEFNRPNVGLLYDVYHADRVGCDLTRIIREEIHWVGHIQIADSPGRHQPGTGKIPFQQFFDLIERTGYGGYIGLEYRPLGSTRDSLTWLQTRTA